MTPYMKLWLLKRYLDGTPEEKAEVVRIVKEHQEQAEKKPSDS